MISLSVVGAPRRSGFLIRGGPEWPPFAYRLSGHVHCSHADPGRPDDAQTGYFGMLIWTGLALAVPLSHLAAAQSSARSGKPPNCGYPPHAGETNPFWPTALAKVLRACAFRPKAVPAFHQQRIARRPVQSVHLKMCLQYYHFSVNTISGRLVSPKIKIGVLGGNHLTELCGVCCSSGDRG